MSTTMTMTKTVRPETKDESLKPSRSLWEDALLRLKKNKAAVFSLYFIVLV